MKKIPLTHGKVAIVSNEDFARLSAFRWHVDRKGYAAANMVVGGKRKLVRMHRFILGISDPSILVDHRDGDTINNQRGNLRACSHKENAWNAKPQRNNTSGFKGVRWSEKNQKWYADIRANGINFFLGAFDTAADAAAAYNEAAIKHFGEFAWLNKLPSDAATTVQKRRPARSGSAIEYRGVIKARVPGRYFAQIIVDRKSIRLGQFDCPVEAAKAYNLAAIKHFGARAVLNDVPEGQPRQIVRISTAGFRGVRWTTQRGKYQAHIYSGKALHLGFFDDPKDAARAYDAAAIKYHGDKAKLNFPEQWQSARL